MKSVFDSLGHYARWDLVNLTNPPAPYEPTTGVGNGVGAASTATVERVIESVAKEFRLEPEKVDQVVRNALNGSGNGVSPGSS